LDRTDLLLLRSLFRRLNCKSLLVGVVVAGCCFSNYGRRWLERGGFLLLIFTMLLFLGLPPPIDTWPASLQAAKEGAATLLR
jgi:hypothetical protein